MTFSYTLNIEIRYTMIYLDLCKWVIEMQLIN